MRKAFRVQQIRARWKVTRLVREDPFKNQYFLAIRVIVLGKLRSRRISNQGGHLA